RRGEISRFPFRRELLLERAQTLEVVEVLTMREQQAPDAVPARRERMLRHSRQRRHTEAEALVALRLQVQKQSGKQEVHRAVGRAGYVAHEIDARLRREVGGQQGRERD